MKATASVGHSCSGLLAALSVPKEHPAVVLRVRTGGSCTLAITMLLFLENALAILDRAADYYRRDPPDATSRN